MDETEELWEFCSAHVHQHSMKMFLEMFVCHPFILASC